MGTVRQRGRFDWLAELGGASALGSGGGYAAFKLAPSFAIAAPSAMTGAGLACFALGMLAMRAAPARRAEHALADFAIEPLETGELLLDMPYEAKVEEEVLLLDEPLPVTAPESRVVELFALPAMPTAGQLKERIDRHLAGAPRSTLPDMQPPQADAAAALYAALDELRRSLR